MAAIKALLFSFVVLVIAHQIVAQQDARSAGWQFPSFSGNFGGFQLPDLPNFGSSNFSSPGLLPFPFQIPGLPSLPSLFPGLGGLIPTTTAPTTTAAAARRRRAAESEDEDSDSSEHQDRLFFSPISFATCNYTSQPGRTCPSCRVALNCLPNNLGLVTRCNFRFCNNGRCSFTPGTACTNSTG